MSNNIATIKNLHVSFPSNKNKKEFTEIVRGVSFDIPKKTIVGFIGESGSGKSVTAKSLLGINNNSVTKAENFVVDGINLLNDKKTFTTKKSVLKQIRGKKVAYVPQDSLTSLNPTMKVGAQIIEALKLHSSEYIQAEVDKKKALMEKLGNKLSLPILEKSKEKVEAEEKRLNDLIKAQGAVLAKEKAASATIIKKIQLKARNDIKKVLKENKEYNELKDYLKNPYKSYAAEMLEKFGITNAYKRLSSYPHEFSGGMRQRVVISMMVACRPDIIIADEPTTALDPTVQASVLNLFQQIVKEFDMSILFISHDISVIATLCDYINVFYAGRIVERGSKKDIFTDPRHPYTWSLLAAMPEFADKDEDLFTIQGKPPSFNNLPKGDPFSVRNPFALKVDFKQEPPLFNVKGNHFAATWLLHPSSPKVNPPAIVQKIIAITKKEL